jgi:hypothetical protein
LLDVPTPRARARRIARGFGGNPHTTNASTHAPVVARARRASPSPSSSPSSRARVFRRRVDE